MKTPEKQAADIMQLAKNIEKIPEWMRDEMAANLKVHKPNGEDTTKLKASIEALHIPQININSTSTHKVFSIDRQ
jgi:hypothetical protein